MIDDHAGLRESLVLALKKECADFAFLQAANGAEAEKQLLKNADCSVLLLDLKLGCENGFSVLERLRQIRPAVRTLVCSAFYEPVQIESALRMRVQGFITKTAGLSELCAALKTVAGGGESFCAEAISVMQSQYGCGSANGTARETMELFSRYKMLSPKEKDVFRLLAQKRDVREIAQTLGKSKKTVENQRTAIYAKMDLHDRLDVMEAARRLGVSAFLH